MQIGKSTTASTITAGVFRFSAFNKCFCLNILAVIIFAFVLRLDFVIYTMISIFYLHFFSIFFSFFYSGRIPRFINEIFSERIQIVFSFVPLIHLLFDFLVTVFIHIIFSVSLQFFLSFCSFRSHLLHLIEKQYTRFNYFFFLPANK